MSAIIRKAKSAPITFIVALIAFGLVGVSVYLKAATAEPPETMSYQGFLVDEEGQAIGQSPVNKEVIFRVFDAIQGGTLLWSEKQIVTINRGYFSVLLGEGSQYESEPRPQLSSIFAGGGVSERFIETTVIGLSIGNTPISPRTQLLSSPFSYLAKRSTVTENVLPTAVGGGVVPIGTIVMWSGTEVPAGWAVCDGANGTPDLRGRMVIGSGAGDGLTDRTLGETGGAETHTLTEAEMPAHSHSTPSRTASTSSGGSHSHTIFGATASDVKSGSSDDSTLKNNDGSSYTESTGSGGTHSHSVSIPGATTDTKGSGAAHNNMSPYYVIAFIMRTA